MNKFLKISQCFFLAVFMISFSLTAVILFRPYYYLNVHLLNIETKSGYNYEEIKDAYNDLMDYLVFGEEFKTGVIPHSDEGKEHFKDVKKLFTFNFVSLITSTFGLLSFFVLQKKNIVSLNYKKLSPTIYSVIGIGSCLLILLVWGSIDFNSLFTVFHKIAFPGKTNWIFDEVTDPIINILPTKLWINYAVLIVLLLAIFISVFIVLEKEKNIKNKISQE